MNSSIDRRTERWAWACLSLILLGIALRVVCRSDLREQEHFITENDRALLDRIGNKPGSSSSPCDTTSPSDRCFLDPARRASTLEQARPTIASAAVVFLQACNQQRERLQTAFRTDPGFAASIAEIATTLRRNETPWDRVKSTWAIEATVFKQTFGLAIDSGYSVMESYPHAGMDKA
jgi:hypothetical protein